MSQVGVLCCFCAVQLCRAGWAGRIVLLPPSTDLLQPRDEEALGAVASEDAEGEAGRRARLAEADPVATLRLSAFCKQQLEVAAGVHGPALNAALNSVDSTIAGQLQAMLASS